MTRIILDPKLPISPTLIRLKATQRTNMGRVIYAYSISLTPGTVTTYLRGDTLVVHALTLAAADALREGEMDRWLTALEGGADVRAPAGSNPGTGGGLCLCRQCHQRHRRRRFAHPVRVLGINGTVFLYAFATKTALFALLEGFPGATVLVPVGLYMSFYGIIYALLANDMRRFLAYSIVNQVGFMVLALGGGRRRRVPGGRSPGVSGGGAKKVRKGRRRLQGARGRGTLATEKPPIFRMTQRGGAVVIRLLESVQQVTIQPLVERFIAPGTQVYTDEYDSYHRLSEGGFDHQTVYHGRGEYVRDDEGDGFHEVHVNTAKRFWSL